MNYDELGYQMNMATPDTKTASQLDVLLEDNALLKEKVGLYKVAPPTYIFSDFSSTASTTSLTPIDIPNFSVTFPLLKKATILTVMEVNIANLPAGLGSQFVQAYINVDGVNQAPKVMNDSDGAFAFPGGVNFLTFSVNTLGAGSHTVKGQFNNVGNSSTSFCYSRLLTVTVLTNFGK